MPAHRQPIAPRFWSKVDKSGECWVWTAGLFPGTGYGYFWLNGEGTLAHRYAYETEVGEIPEGLTIDHLCRVRACVRPDHLEAVTLKENILRGESAGAKNARKTECIHGHPFDAANTYLDPRGWRQCRACLRQRARARNASQA